MVVRKIKWRPLKVRTNSRSYRRGKFKKWMVTACGKNYGCVYENGGGIILHDKRKLVYEKLAIPTKRLLVCVRNILFKYLNCQWLLAFVRYLAVLVFPTPLTRFEQKFEIGEKIKLLSRLQIEFKYKSLGVFAFMYVSGNE